MIASYTSSGCRSSLIFSTLFSLWCSLRIRTPYRTSHKVQTAFGFIHVRPAARPGVFARGHRPGTRVAPYAAVTHAKEGVERNVVPPDVLVYLVRAPTGERGDLGYPEVLIKSHDRRARPLGRLIPADPRHPGAVVPQETPLGLDLADLAAEIRRATVELGTVTRYLFLDRDPRREHLERQRIPLHGLLAETHGLLEEKPRIQRKDLRHVGDAREHVQKDHPLRIPEGDREGEVIPVDVHGPAQDLLRRTTLQTLGRPREIPSPCYLIVSLWSQSLSHEAPSSEKDSESRTRKLSTAADATSSARRTAQRLVPHGNLACTLLVHAQDSKHLSSIRQQNSDNFRRI